MSTHKITYEDLEAWTYSIQHGFTSFCGKNVLLIFMYEDLFKIG